MKNGKKKQIFLTALLLVLALCSIVYAAKVNEIAFTNHVETGSVDVKIEQFEMTEDGRRVAFPGEVMPNMDVSYIPCVTNLRADSYVRVKMEVIMDEEIPIPITTADMYGISSDWVRIGDYFYCKKILKTNESSDILEGFHVPEGWTHATASPFTIRLTADAIQCDYFEPDFTSASPWGLVEIEEAKEEDDITYGIAKEKEASPVFEYRDGTGFESATSDLFKNFDYHMAGDTYSDRLTMKNVSSKKIKLYFKTETVESDLLEQMSLSIDCDGEHLYSGDLLSKKIDDWIELTEIDSGKSKDLSFEVQLPVSSKNYYSVLQDKVVWKFKALEIEDPNSGATRTGDIQNPLLYAALAVIAGVLLIAAVATRRKDKEQEKEGRE